MVSHQRSLLIQLYRVWVLLLQYQNFLNQMLEMLEGLIEVVFHLLDISMMEELIIEGNQLLTHIKEIILRERFPLLIMAKTYQVQIPKNIAKVSQNLILVKISGITEQMQTM
jgi:hypothetical protein